MQSQENSNGPILIRPEEVSQDLFCSICMNVPTKPVITPCEHLFCQHCVKRHLKDHLNCPVDRKLCRPEDIKSVMKGTFIYRIWSSIKVKCEYHNSGCLWIGEIGGYTKHSESCQADKGNGVFKLKQLMSNLEQECKQLKKENQTVKSSLSNRPDVPILFHGQYDFDRRNVVPLSQLISRYLENKPNNIDGHKIFSCVKNINMDLEREWEDNPEHFYTDVRMLVVTCAASTWFTKKQNKIIRRWMDDHTWS